jgi:transposase
LTVQQPFGITVGMTITPTITLEQLQTENSELQAKINRLEEQLDWFRRQIFGKRSEKFVDQGQQLSLDIFGTLEPAPEKGKKPVAAHERGKRKNNGKDTITLPDNLPVERRVYDLSEDEKICSETGEPLVKIGEEVTRKLAHKPGSYFIKEIVRPKYALPKNSEEGIRTAPLPDSLLNRCQADESLLAEILVKKFCDHLPLYRQTEQFERDGIGISRQIISQWVVRCGMALKPLYEEMTRKVLQSGNVFADETSVDMLDPGKGKVHQAYMWVLVGGRAVDPPYRIYNFRTNRNHNNAVELLKGYSGILHSDKYGAYEVLANKKQFIWCPCWAHIRRKFVEAESGDPDFQKEVLRLIQNLFMLEREAWAKSEEERLQIRQEKEAPIIDQLIILIKDKLVNGKILPKSKLREALGYFCSLIPHLKNYIQHAWAHLDNNVAERAIRPLALGRKNWLFVGSEIGGEAAAVILTLVQSCRAIEINPREYLEDVMRRLLDHPANKLHELLPDEWAAARVLLPKN